MVGLTGDYIQIFSTSHHNIISIFDPVPNFRFAIELQLSPSVALKLVLIRMNSVSNSLGDVSNLPQGVGTRFCNLVVNLSKTSFSTGLTKSPSSMMNCLLIQSITKESTLDTASLRIRAFNDFHQIQTILPLYAKLR